MSELRECPFCPGRGWLIELSSPKRWRTQCRTCGAGHGEFDTKKQAVTAWNTRATAAPVVVGEVTSDMVDVALQAYDDVYEAEYIRTGGFTDNKRVAMRAALTAALAWD